jgi:hypothetical protein
MLQLEGLEDRMVMSTVTQTGTTLLLNASTGFFRPAIESPLTHLCGMDRKHDFGNGTGSYTRNDFPIRFEGGPIYQFTGSGNFLDLKNATITGSVIAVGQLSPAPARGELTFTNSQGSVTIDLIGPEQTGFSPLPSTFRFTVVRETGAYAGLKGSGSLTLKLGPASGQGSFIESGEFTLTIDSFNKIRHGIGTYTRNVELDAGVQYQVTGVGQFFGLKDAQIAGSLYSVGFIRSGHARGELTFSNAKGSVTIDLMGPQQPGFSPLPDTFRFTLKKGTGAYAHITGHGSLSLKLSPTTDQGLPSGGEFTLTIDSFTKR